MRTKLTLYAVLLLLLASSLIALLPGAPQEHAIPPAFAARTPRANSATTSRPAAATAIQTILIVSGQRFSKAIRNAQSVESFMRELASTSDFTYTADSYPSLGLFVESIQGVQNEGGKYWMLYINGTLSPAGVSNAIIHPGDVIEWKYE